LGTIEAKEVKTLAVEVLAGPPKQGSPRGRPWWSMLWESISCGFVREVLLAAGAMLLYFGVRNLTAGSAATAFHNAERLLALEERLGVAWEMSAQAAIASSETLVTLANWVYIWGHWPVILPVAIALFLLRRRHYYLLRNAIFISGAIGFLWHHRGSSTSASSTP
jgi:hypothetical protein